MLWKQILELFRQRSSQIPLFDQTARWPGRIVPWKDLLRVGSIDDLYVSWFSQNLPAARIEEVMTLASNVFGDRQVAKDWLTEPNLATGNRPPIALLGTGDGLLRVQTLLHRIEYGVLA